MKQESIDHLKKKMIETYCKQYGDKKVCAAPEHQFSSIMRFWTGNELAAEVENETEFGLKLIDMMISLTIDLLSRDKIKPPEDKNIYHLCDNCSSEDKLSFHPTSGVANTYQCTKCNYNNNPWIKKEIT